MSSRENAPPPPPVKLSGKNVLPEFLAANDDDSDAEISNDALNDAIFGLTESVKDLNIDKRAHEFSTNIQIDPLYGTGRNDVVANSEITIETIAGDHTSKKMEEIIPNIICKGVLQDQEPDVTGACVFRVRLRDNTPPPLPLKLSGKDELSVIPVFSDGDFEIAEMDFETSTEVLRLIMVSTLIARETLTNVQVDPTCGDARKADHEPDVTDASNRRERRKSAANQTQKQLSKNTRDKRALLVHKCENVDYFGADMDLRDKIDASIRLYTNIIIKLNSIDRVFDFVLDRFKEHKKFHILLKSLHVFNTKFQYLREFHEDVDKVFKCRATINESAAGASSSKDAIQSSISASDHEIICGRYINISTRINERVIEYSTLYEDLSSSLETHNVSSERLNSLRENANNYRFCCSERVKTIPPILNLFKENVERKIKDCERITDDLCELAKDSSNNAETKDKAKNLYSSSLIAILKIRVQKKEFQEDCEYMNQKIADMKTQSDSLEFWGPLFSTRYEKDPNFIMKKTNSLIKLNFEVLDSLRNIFSDYRYIIAQANLMAK